MPPRKRKRAERDDEPLMEVCPVCDEPQVPRAFPAHVRMCRINQRNADQMRVDAQMAGKKNGRRAETKMPKLRLNKSHKARARRAVQEPASLDIDMGYQPQEPLPDLQLPPADPDSDPSIPLVRLPSHYVLTIPHRHSGLPATILPLNNPPPLQTPRTFATGMNPAKPYRPFRTYADYDFTSNCVRWAKGDKQIKEELDRLRTGIWVDGKSKITFRTVKDVKDALRVARHVVPGIVQFERTTITVDFTHDAETKRFSGAFNVQLDFRDAWKVVRSWVCDETLAPHSTWFSVEKFYCRGGTCVEHKEVLIDEPWTGRTWREVDDSLPGWTGQTWKEGLQGPQNQYPSCYLPLHIWLDKGMVSTKVKMHPILLRGLWIHSAIRNASGNGGSALLGYITMPPELRNTDWKTLSGPEKEDFARLKSTIYNSINSKILDSLKARSHYGETFRFGDGIYRTAYPGILIESMDFQELACWLAIRSAIANFPCPKCLVPKHRLAELTQPFKHRSPAAMANVVRRARKKGTKKEREVLLRNSGLHDIEQILWGFANSDPYKASSYDTLHWTDGGKFGRHLWEHVKEVLINMGETNEFNKCMQNLPRWRGMDHISAATLIDFAEGNTFLDILKEIDKDFNFLKQHYTCHAPGDIREKGTTNHMSTRPGEGFQQEVNRHYDRTNGRDAEHQMVLIDENEEAMARLDMIVADSKAQEKQAAEDSEDGAAVVADAVSSDVHWCLAAPNARMSSARFEAQMTRASVSQDFDGFDIALREFLANRYPEFQISFEQILEVQSFRAVHLEFQSRVDWSPQRDILRCSPSFFGHPRYDCVLFNAEEDPLSLARLVALLRCKVPDGRSFDLAFVRRFKNSKWRPRTDWKGCRVVEEASKSAFLPLEHIARGAFLARAWGTTRTNLFFPLDTVDDDMFLRLNNIE
ncbi:hypothetical protein GGX14DRAFT_565809 [Mycena pura]|uniref:Uncharacterized protein n=1 Tax=Mycena pura TaxID=153505 RepID=A0AAD6YHA4_9AGAR|nr:hypothetical protein GGX14DRAFT_565809 [Mycena pura]